MCFNCNWDSRIYASYLGIMMAYSKTSNYSILRRVCRIMKILGLGDYWYENPDDDNLLYWWYNRIVFLHYFIMIFFELLEVAFDTYPEDMHNDAMAVAAGHCVVLMRLLATISNKKKIRDFHRFLVEDCQGYEEEELMERQYKKIRLAVLLQLVAVYSTIFMYVLEGLRRKFIDKTSFIVFASYWPTYVDTSYTALAARIAIAIVCILILSSMIAADTLVISHFVLLAYKLENLTRYFKTIEMNFSSLDTPTLELKNQCLKGLMLHQRIISSATKIQDCFGFMMSVQVLQGPSVVVLVLLKLALTKDLTIAKIILNCNFLVGLLVQLASYLWNGGDITYQASLMSEAIFHSGWERRGARTQAERELRRVVLMGIAQAQRPLVLKAFGVQQLSYQTFVSVIRATYSLFAVVMSTKN